MGKSLKLLLLIVIVGITTFICVTECKKHKDKKKHHRLLEHHHRHHHQQHRHRHHKHTLNKHDEQKSEIEKEELHKNEAKILNFKTLREEMRKFHEKINKMLPRCKSWKECPAGTCCWKGRCKILPHRLNQRCSTACPCSDAKKSMYCHVKKVGLKTSMYGRCYIKGEELGIKGVNFIPETIEKLKNVEKKMMKEKAVEKKKKSTKKERKRNKTKGKKNKKHDQKGN